jgi:tricarballylate dehydrogenase
MPACAPRTTLEPYPRDAFLDDMRRLTEGRCDPVLTDALVDGSEDVVGWLAGLGMRWRLMYERQAYDRDGCFTFWGGLAIGTVEGGKGLMAGHLAAARREGIRIAHGVAVGGLLRPDEAVQGVRCRTADGRDRVVRADAVVLAAGGFEASGQLRERHLGPGWERAHVRGTPTNTGEVLLAAIDAGAARHGDWGSCHSVAWGAGADPAGGDRELTNQLTRGGYPLGIVVNRDGRRFVDEGADYRNFTYARYGSDILAQPGGVAFQLFDAHTRPLLRAEEYDSQQVTGVSAGTLEELAARLGIDPEGLGETVARFNAAVRDDVAFDPAVKDGRGTAGIAPPKSNWAQALDRPPFFGFAVTCGVTFTFGGLHIDADARVLDGDGAPIPGLHAAGELVGGLFFGNYPGGTGLTAGRCSGGGPGRERRRARPRRRRSADERGARDGGRPGGGGAAPGGAAVAADAAKELAHGGVESRGRRRSHHRARPPAVRQAGHHPRRGGVFPTIARQAASTRTRGRALLT